MKELKECETPEEILLWLLAGIKFHNDASTNTGEFAANVCTAAILAARHTKDISKQHPLKNSTKVYLLVWVPENAFDDEARTIDVYSSKKKLMEDHKNAKELMGTDTSGYFWEEMEIKK